MNIREIKQSKARVKQLRRDIERERTADERTLQTLQLTPLKELVHVLNYSTPQLHPMNITGRAVGTHLLIKPQEISDIKMACIFDEFSMSCFQEEVHLISFKPEDWEAVLTDNVPHLLMVESAWRGNDGAWEYKIGKYRDADNQQLLEVIEWCRRRRIPTVFWNKEDPIHFEKFIDTAKHFDYIFTTDSRMIDHYQREVGHQNIFALPFAAQPKRHNPIKITDERQQKISFAGSFYANRHTDRQNDMERLLDLAAQFGLDIYDRNFAINKDNEQSDFSFPERFKENIKGCLAYDEIDKAYKGYKAMLNVNSVKHSPTMFSRRVFEGLASGTPIISSYSVGIKALFNHVVLMSENMSDLEKSVSRLMNEECFYRQKALEGIREIYLNHTYKHRIKCLLDKVGIEVSSTLPSVSVLAIVNTADEFATLLKQFKRQTWQRKQLIVLLTPFEGYIDILNAWNTDSIKSFILSYMNNYERIDEVIDTDYVALFSPDDFYGDHYLMDLMVATQYSQADIIGKGNFYTVEQDTQSLSAINNGKEYEYVEALSSRSALAHKSIFKGMNMGQILELICATTDFNSFFKKGYRLFSIDKFNYIQNGSLVASDVQDKVEL
ncbi:glycosyl transferase [Pullulanibacillus camelliae]|uniref:Glycosyl transferase n=1 Tax=Pullulanibacillus camelliae TaxID=1707096 RepID=A0A8J2YNP7_9BACL|nr:glycosyltransferase [Pullulanibacillus camelliae]GGE56689.1 glycosyl transferase [Pullulanibacillus camelliae]